MGIFLFWIKLAVWVNKRRNKLWRVSIWFMLITSGTSRLFPSCLTATPDDQEKRKSNNGQKGDNFVKWTTTAFCKVTAVAMERNLISFMSSKASSGHALVFRWNDLTFGINLYKLTFGADQLSRFQCVHRSFFSTHNMQVWTLTTEPSRPGLLKWRTAVRIRTFGWWRPDLVSLLKVYFISRSFYPKMLRFWPCF